MVKKALCSFLMVLLVLQACCGFAFAEEETAAEVEESPSPEAGVVEVSGIEAVQTGDHILFGTYNELPVEWTVLDNATRNDGAPGMFLFATYAVQESGIIYNSTEPATWAGSAAQASCQQFYNDAFSELEKALIPAVSVTEEISDGYGLSWQPADLDGEYVFYLSVPELIRYYGEENGVAGLATTSLSGYGVYYWLRSPQNYTTVYAGTVYSGNYENVAYILNSQAGRPATNMSPDTIFYVTPYGTTADGITIWKAALQDENADFSITGMQRDGDTLTLSWETADYGENRKLAVLIYNEHRIPTGVYSAGILDAESGTTEVDLTKLTVPDDSTLAFCAVTSSDSSAVDVISTPVEFKYTVSFDAGWGSGTIDPITAEPGSDVQLPECTFTAPENQVFDHWECDGEAFDPLATITVNNDMVLNAVYTDLKSEEDVSTAGEASGPISLNFNQLSLTIGQGTLVSAVMDDAASGQTLTWSTDKGGVVRLTPRDNNTCRVTSLWPGATTLRCTSADGSTTAELPITVTGNPLVEFIRTQEGIAACVLLAVGVIAFFGLRKRAGKAALLALALPAIFLLVAIGLFLGIL